MSHDAALRTYCRSVGRSLRLSKRRKAEILAGLRQELEERFPEPDDLTMEELREEVGLAEETADALMESVPREERERHRVWQKRLTGCVIAGLAIMLVASVAFFVYTAKSQVVRAKSTITIDSITVIDNTQKEP